MSRPSDIYGCYSHVNNDNLRLNSNPGKRYVYSYNEICQEGNGKK